MTTTGDLRKAGQRKQPRGSPGASLLGPTLGIHTNDPGERRLNSANMWAIDSLFNSHPAVQASRTILHGQLIGGGITLKRKGAEIELKPAFKQHIEEMWLPFAKDVIDMFIKFGFCLVSYEEDTHSILTQRRKRPKGPGAPAEPPKESPNYVPIVPQMGTFEVAYVMGGRNGYKRDYFVYGTAPGRATTIDDEMRLIVRQQPDAVGNVNSPMQSVYDLGSFVSALTELAMTAEITNARPRLFTQKRVEKGQGGLDQAALFFDSESRAVQSSQETEESAGQAHALAMQSALMKWINHLQTTSGPETGGRDINMQSFSGGGGVAQGKQTHVPPEIPPTLFTLPQGQEVVPNAFNPQARSDLESLIRLAVEQFGAALGKKTVRTRRLPSLYSRIECCAGVPSELIFQSRFSSNSTSQCASPPDSWSLPAETESSSVCAQDEPPQQHDHPAGQERQPGADDGVPGHLPGRGFGGRGVLGADHCAACGDGGGDGAVRGGSGAD